MVARHRAPYDAEGPLHRERGGAFRGDELVVRQCCEEREVHEEVEHDHGHHAGDERDRQVLAWILDLLRRRTSRSRSRSAPAWPRSWRHETRSRPPMPTPLAVDGLEPDDGSPSVKPTTMMAARPATFKTVNMRLMKPPTRTPR